MSSGEELITVDVDQEAKLRVCYKQEHGLSSLVFFSEGRLSLAAAQGAVKQAVLQSNRPNGRVRFRPAQGKAPAQLIVEYTSPLTDEESLTFAQVFMQAIKLRG